MMGWRCGSRARVRVAGQGGGLIGFGSWAAEVEDRQEHQLQAHSRAARANNGPGAGGGCREGPRLWIRPYATSHPYARLTYHLKTLMTEVIRTRSAQSVADGAVGMVNSMLTCLEKIGSYIGSNHFDVLACPMSSNKSIQARKKGTFDIADTMGLAALHLFEI